MRGLLIAFAVSLAGLVAFSVVIYGAPLLAAGGLVAGSALTIVALLGSTWLRQRLEGKR
jgi:hypothetical protein